MGRYKREKHVNQEMDITYNDPKISSEEIRNLLPILKEVIKEVYPPVWMSIELAYFIYENSEELIGILNCLKNGDPNEAIELAKKIFAREAVEFVLGYIYSFYSEEYVNSLSDSVSSSVKGDTNKEIVKRITQGTIDGMAELVNEKISDKIVEEVYKNENK